MFRDLSNLRNLLYFFGLKEIMEHENHDAFKLATIYRTDTDIFQGI